MELEPQPVYQLPEKPRLGQPDKHGVELIEVGDVIVLDRARVDYGDVIELSKQITDAGRLINPITVGRMNGGKFKLLAGGRRLRAVMILGWKQIPATILAEHEVTPVRMKIIELLENIGRKDYDVMERALNIRQIHALQQQEYGESGKGLSGGWKQEDTAKALKISESHLRRNLTLAEHILKNPTAKEALGRLDLNTAVRKIKNDSHVKRVEGRITSGDLVVSGEIKFGDALVLIKEVPPESIDLLLTDGPFGLQEIQESLGKTKGPSSTYTALLGESDNMTIDSCMELYTQICPELFRVLKPSAHLYMFCSGELQLRLVPLLQDAGFEINENVLIWDKTKTTTPFKGLEYPSAYEPIIFGHKPPRSKHLLLPDCSNIQRFPAIHSSKKLHRFQKPIDLLSYLIRNSSRPGDRVLDPFAGSGVVIRTSKELNRNGLGFELDKKNWMQAQMVLMHGVQKAREILAVE